MKLGRYDKISILKIRIESVILLFSFQIFNTVISVLRLIWCSLSVQSKSLLQGRTG